MPVFNQEHIKHYRFKQLFNELGWDAPAQQQPYSVLVGDDTWLLDVVAHKKSVQVLHCRPGAQGQLPDYATRQKIERKITTDVREHLIVFTNEAKTLQVWQWVTRQAGKPAQYREVFFRQGEAPELLAQKLSRLHFTLDEEELLTVLGVTQRLDDAAPRDKVTKKFYGEFEKQRKAFAAFIEGIPADSEDQRWYTAVVIDRLMFLWFLQEKGFLDNQRKYLQQRLQAHLDGDNAQSFYKRFLSPLFFQGFAQERTPETAAAIQAAFGSVPYLNGGLFAQHELEQRYGEALDIADNAFQKLFAFFDEWEWHLDERPLKSGKEINPDVLGYIFEKFVNQKQMGAYYTKEDITEYISKNTVIPHLLEKARERCKVAFASESSVWKLLQAEPDRYIYPAMKTGVIDASGQPVPESVLPDFVQTGMKDAKARMFDRRYNLGEASFTTATGERGTLPTETWREYVNRRSRYLAVREQLANGEVQSADDLITLNLDIRQFMQDVIDTATSPELLRAVWQAIVGRVPEKSNEKFRHGITILDPTCGSGAFLFAALNILEPLYEACLDRMEGFVEDAQKLGKPGEADFVKVLAEVGKHPSRRYYVYKSIILHNLFGVDIMAEAVEICKLRLFLKLVSQVDKGQQLEPLPDIDFNIRAGNTLVGYATEAQFDASGDLASDQQHKSSIKADIADLADLFSRFREQQTVQGGKVTAQDKRRLRDKLKGLSLELDRYQAHDYGINPANAKAFADWRASHQPFHWFAEFYGVMRESGFDVVIGNPPYVAKRKVTGYTVKGYATADCTDIYAWCLERVIAIAHAKAYTGMIVPLSLSFSGDFDVLRKLLYTRYHANWFSHFAKRPSMLFTGVQVRNTIHVGKLGGTQRQDQTSRIHRWPNEARSHLFATLSYAAFNPNLWKHRIPKLNTQGLIDAFEKNLVPGGRTIEATMNRHATAHALHFKKTAYNWLSFTHEEAPCFDAKGKRVPQNEYGQINFQSADDRDMAFLLLNGKIQLAFWIAIGDDFHVTKGNFADLPLVPGQLTPEVQTRLKAIVPELSAALEDAIVYMPQFGKQIGNYNLAKCRPVTDQADRIYAQAFGLMPVWDDIELLYAQTVKTNFEDSTDDDA